MAATHSIERIFIKKVRHLRDVEIVIGRSENGSPKHLILTGPNGSGKTSLLQALRDHLQGVPTNQWLYISAWRQSNKEAQQRIQTLEARIASADGPERTRMVNEKNTWLANIQNNENALRDYESLDVDIQDATDVLPLYQEGRFILAFFAAQRKNEMPPVTSIQKITPQQRYDLNEEARRVFLQYIVDLQATRSFAREAGNVAKAHDIEAWFAKFEQALKDIYEDEGLQLSFDIETFGFRIQLSDGHEPFDFNQLSDGYQALLSIVTELILRMESNAPKAYDLPGIVLIDEIETHLHVSLQKQVLPFLTRFFPKVQFIVTSHSPFVLTSLSNAVVFDLGTRTRVEDLSGYSSEAVLQGYFGQDKYSLELKKDLEKYRSLWQSKNSLTDPELDELEDLRARLHELPKAFSPELEAELRSIEEKAS